MKFVFILISASVAALALFQAASAMTVTEFIEAISVPNMLELSNAVASKTIGYKHILFTEQDLTAAAEYIEKKKEKFPRVLQKAAAKIPSIQSKVFIQGISEVAAGIVAEMVNIVDYDETDKVSMMINIIKVMSTNAENVPKTD